jgi:ribosomal protein S18 acetylase RimI-like enzyme
MARLREASAPADVESARELFAEYARAVDAPCCFAGLEREIHELPRGYRLLLLAYEDDNLAGCVALRELDRATAEVKRLYVRRAYRGRGTGRALIEAALGAARNAGYARVVLDSLPGMRQALALYRALGFCEIPPYLAEPTPGATCFELEL